MQETVKSSLTAAVVTSAAALAVFAGSPPDVSRTPVLLELFTSEGCSSCPPADKVLEALDKQPIANVELIVLSEHVDYWNSLGWRDPYSSRAFSDRQSSYAERLAATVYTPQLLIDGQVQLVGSDQREVTQAIGKVLQTAKRPITLHAARLGSSGGIRVEANSGAPADLYLAFAADHTRTEVLRGENGGHTLTHVAVVKSILKIGKWEGTATSREIPIPSKLLTGQSGETRVVAILEDPQTGRILGAAQTRF